MKNINCLKINKKENLVLVSVNPKIYPLDVIYSASYVFLDKCYILLDGKPEKEVLVELRPKNQKQDLEKLSREFCNELLNYATYKARAGKTKKIRETILKKVLLTNDLKIDD